jgi:hypothetical protein
VGVGEGGGEGGEEEDCKDVSRRGKGDSVLFKNNTKFRTAEIGSIFCYNHKINDS